MEVFRFTVLASLALVACVRGQAPYISLTASSSLNYLFVDDEQKTPLPNSGNWPDLDVLPIDTFSRLVAIRANNLQGGCSGILVAISDHPFAYDFVSNDQWVCSASPNNGWEYLGYDDSDWTPAFQVGRNGVVPGCSLLPIADVPAHAFWIWTPAYLNGDQIVSCRGYTPICEYTPCQNGGTCNKNKPNLCTCPIRWGGRFCDQPINECDSVPCLNGGRCELTNEGEGFACTCAVGYTGVRCETDTTECASAPCQNGGTCNFFIGEGYSCDCEIGFTGDDCETNIDECQITPCQHGGTCTDAVNGVVCDCVPGYAGILCQNDINECLNNQCQNGGTCVDLINDYECDCNSGHEGELCERPIGGCSTAPCANGGTCTLDGAGDTVLCNCAPGWYGDTCTSNADDCAVEPCLNGGRCIDGEETFLCECTDAYYGDKCDLVVPNCGSLMTTSNLSPQRNFWSLCEINIAQHPALTNTTCRNLIQDINHYNDSATIIELGGNFGCFPTKFPDEISSGACMDDYKQDARLADCLSCTHMGVCIKEPEPTL